MYSINTRNSLSNILPIGITGIDEIVQNEHTTVKKVKNFSGDRIVRVSIEIGVLVNLFQFEAEHFII